MIKYLIIYPILLLIQQYQHSKEDLGLKFPVLLLLLKKFLAGHSDLYTIMKTHFCFSLYFVQNLEKLLDEKRMMSSLIKKTVHFSLLSIFEVNASFVMNSLHGRGP